MKAVQWAGVAVLLATVPLAACSTHNCTLIGGTSSLTITNPSRLTALHAIEVRFCVTRTACVTQAVPSRDSIPGRVETELLSRATTSVTITASDAKGVAVLQETKAISPTLSYPNGQGCAPTIWNATLTL